MIFCFLEIFLIRRLRRENNGIIVIGIIAHDLLVGDDLTDGLCCFVEITLLG